MKMLVAYWVLMRLLWRTGTARLRRGLTDALGTGAVDDNLDDLIMATHDTYIIEMYKLAAQTENMGLREFLLKYGLAKVREKK